MEICSKIKPLYKEVEPGHFCACHLYNTEEDVKRLENDYEIMCEIEAEEEARQAERVTTKMKNKLQDVKKLIKKKPKEEDNAEKE